MRKAKEKLKVGFVICWHWRRSSRLPQRKLRTAMQVVLVPTGWLGTSALSWGAEAAACL